VDNDTLLTRFNKMTHGQPVPALLALILIVVVVTVQAPVFLTGRQTSPTSSTWRPSRRSSSSD
jgi:hypothetical protein